MIFGSTYCAISHLEIKDGDKCILLPLAFRMDYKFDRYNKADINSFAYLYAFHSDPVEVVFYGNVAKIDYATDVDRHHRAGDDYEEHELFMLVHWGFYNEIINNVSRFDLDHLEDVPLMNTTYPIWEKAKEMSRDIRYENSIKLVKKLITVDDVVKKTPTPEPMKNIFKVAIFMGSMGIPPHPNWAHDQRETGKDYEMYRKNAIKNYKTKKTCQNQEK